MTNTRHQLETKMGEIGIPHAEGKPFPIEPCDYKEYLSGMSDAVLATTAYDANGDRKKIRSKTTLGSRAINLGTKRPFTEDARIAAPDVFKNLVNALGIKVPDICGVNETNALKHAVDKAVKSLDTQSKGTVKALQDFAKGSMPHYKVLRVVGFFDGSDNDYDYGIVNFYNYVCFSSQGKKTKKGEAAAESKKQNVIQKRVMNVFIDLLLKNGREPLSKVLKTVQSCAQARLTFDHFHIAGTTATVSLDYRRLLSLYGAFIAEHGNPNKIKPVKETATPQATSEPQEVPTDFNNRVVNRAQKLESKCLQLLGEAPAPSTLLFKKMTLALFQEKVDTIQLNLMACIESSGVCSPTNLKAYMQAIDTPFTQASEALKAYRSALDEEASLVRTADGLLDQIVQLITRRDTHVAAEACQSMIDRINLQAHQEV